MMPPGSVPPDLSGVEALTPDGSIVLVLAVSFWVRQIAGPGPQSPLLPPLDSAPPPGGSSRRDPGNSQDRSSTGVRGASSSVRKRYRAEILDDLLAPTRRALQLRQGLQTACALPSLHLLDQRPSSDGVLPSPLPTAPREHHHRGTTTRPRDSPRWAPRPFHFGAPCETPCGTRRRSLRGLLVDTSRWRGMFVPSCEGMTWLPSLKHILQMVTRSPGDARLESQRGGPAALPIEQVWVYWSMIPSWGILIPVSPAGRRSNVDEQRFYAWIAPEGALDIFALYFATGIPSLLFPATSEALREYCAIDISVRQQRHQMRQALIRWVRPQHSTLSVLCRDSNWVTEPGDRVSKAGEASPVSDASEQRYWEEIVAGPLQHVELHHPLSHTGKCSWQVPVGPGLLSPA